MLGMPTSEASNAYFPVKYISYIDETYVTFLTSFPVITLEDTWERPVNSRGISQITTEMCRRGCIGYKKMILAAPLEIEIWLVRALQTVHE